MESFLEKIGLDTYKVLPDLYLNTIVSDCFGLSHGDFNENEVRRLYEYDVPQISPDGSCSLKEKEEKPYNLAAVLGLENSWELLKSHSQTLQLWRLYQVIDQL